MQQTRKVLYLITKSNWGGAQRYVYDLATNLDSQFEPVVALGGNGPLKDKLESAGIPVISIPGLQRDISFQKELLSMWHLARIIRDEDPDVLHINSSKAGALGALLGRILFVPKVIFTAHGWAFNEKRSHVSKFLIKTIHWCTVLLTHQTIAVSHNLKSQLTWPGAQAKMTVIHNGRTIPHFAEREAARKIMVEHAPTLAPYTKDFWSVSLGELHPIKGHDVAISALTNIVTKVPNIRHIIISDGEERLNLEALVAEYNLTEHVFFTGAIDEAAQYLKAFDLFVLPSRSEALAYVVIEACFAGLPIIATEVGGVPEIITSAEYGILIPPDETTSLETTYLALYRDTEKQQRLSKAATERAESFTAEAMVSKTQALYVH